MDKDRKEDVLTFLSRICKEGVGEYFTSYSDPGTVLRTGPKYGLTEDEAYRLAVAGEAVDAAIREAWDTLTDIALATGADRDELSKYWDIFIPLEVEDDA